MSRKSDSKGPVCHTFWSPKRVEEEQNAAQKRQPQNRSESTPKSDPKGSILFWFYDLIFIWFLSRTSRFVFFAFVLLSTLQSHREKHI